MDLGLISVRYARALLKACMEANVSHAVYGDMQTLAANYAHLPELKLTIGNPMLSKEQKKQLLTAAAGNDRCSLTDKFVNLVVEEGREGIMQFIAHSFIGLYRKQYNIISAKLVTATAPTPQIEVQLKQLVGKQAKGDVEFISEVDPDIIGGFVLEYDTYRMDASIKSQLNTILSKLK